MLLSHTESVLQMAPRIRSPTTAIESIWPRMDVGIQQNLAVTTSKPKSEY